MRRPYRYQVTEVHNALVPNVEQGSVLREDNYRGRTHTYMIEINGNVTPWASVVYIGKARGEAPDGE